MQQEHSAKFRYGVAVFAVVLFTLLRFPFSPLLGATGAPFLFCFPAIMVSGWYGGLGPGLLSTGLSALAAQFFFVNAMHSVGFNNQYDGLRLLLVVSQGVFISLVNEAWHRSKTRTEQANRSLKQRVQELQIVMDTIPVPLWIASDPEGRKGIANRAANELMRLPPNADPTRSGPHEELVSGFKSYRDGKQLAAEDMPLRYAALNRREVRKAELDIELPDGTQKHLYAYASPLFDGQGKVRGSVAAMMDLTERRQAEDEREAALQSERAARAEAEMSHAQVINILETMNDGFYALDQDWRFTYVNGRIKQMSQRSPESLIGKIIWEQFPNAVGSLDEIKLRQAMNERTAVHFQAFNSQYKIWYEVDAYPSPEGISVFIRDISDQKLADEERAQLLAREQAARTEAETANRLKDEFLATVSHELRTPLNSILGWSNVLKQGDIDGAMKQTAVEVIERNARAQAQIINDILDVSRIITGKLRIDLQPNDPSTIVGAAVDTIRPAAEAKEISVTLTLEHGNRLVLCDPSRLQQIVWNLLVNAVKFTPQGGRIEVALKQRGSQLEIVVRDNGKGINAQFLPYVFDRFRQADSSMTRRHSGLGLGLAIVRHLVELHGGTVLVASEGEDLGATFTVALPLVSIHAKEGRIVDSSSASEPALETAAPSAATVLAGLKVLVVDDDQDTREVLHYILTNFGAEVQTAGSSIAALNVIKDWKPGILVSDIGMPGEDGFSFIRRLRALPPEEGSAIPALALTAYARTEDRLRALEVGYQAHLTKPIETTELVEAIAGLTGLNSRPQERAAH